MSQGPMYKCSVCSLGVIALKSGDETTFIRGCKCNAAVTASMRATVVARGGTKQQTRAILTGAQPPESAERG